MKHEGDSLHSLKAAPRRIEVELIVKAIQPVGEGLFFDDVPRLQEMYKPVKATAAA